MDKLVYNDNPRPFKVGDILKRVYGVGLSEVVGYKGDMIRMKSLNEEDLYGVDEIQPFWLNVVKSLGYKPSPDSIRLIHYKYANDFEVVPQPIK